MNPLCNNILIRVYAADHGVFQQGVSAFPQEVTAQMILNFLQGGAAISVLSKRLDADFQVVNMGTITAIDDAPGLNNIQLQNGSNDFTQGEAMTHSVMIDALNAGQDQVKGSTPELYIGGEMGIGNTTSASAIISLVLNLPADVSVGPGTGIDEAGMQRKINAVRQAIKLHANYCDSPLEILRRVGGLEITALVGSYIGCAQQGIPVLVDGFITTAAALIAVSINPDTRQWLIFGHQSAEPAHHHALQYLDAKPLLDLGMRLGEGSGAAVAVAIIQSALALHNQMATFTAAGVSK